MTAVCTTRADSAEAARQACRCTARVRRLPRNDRFPDIDAVAVVVRVPSHYAPTKAALEAGKHVYCEWPLGRTTAEATELSALAKANRLVTAVGLQARVNPAVMYTKELIESGYLGDIMAVHVSVIRDGVLSRPSNRTWQRDVELGANTLTIAAGHTIDAMRFVAGDFGRFSTVVATQAKQWLDTGSGTWLDVTSPDNVMLSGRLTNGAVVSVHVGAIPFAGSGYRMEIYGRNGTLVASGNDSPQLGEVVLHGAQAGNTLAPMPVPERLSLRCSWHNGQGKRPTSAKCTLVRAGDPYRCKQPADLRDGGRPAPLGRRHQPGVGYRSRGECPVARRRASIPPRVSVARWPNRGTPAYRPRTAI